MYLFSFRHTARLICVVGDSIMNEYIYLSENNVDISTKYFIFKLNCIFKKALFHFHPPPKK